MSDALRARNLKRQALVLRTAAAQLVREQPFLSPPAVELREMLLRQHADRLSTEIETMLLWDECVSMAYLERTGLELAPGEEYSAADAKRAVEIKRMYPSASK